MHWRELRQDPLRHPGLRLHYYRGETRPLQEVAARLWAELEPLAAYSEQERELSWLKRQLFDAPPEAGLIDASGDFRAAWGIGPADYEAPAGKASFDPARPLAVSGLPLTVSTRTQAAVVPTLTSQALLYV
ncbi:putative amidoligase domain-containing protein [Gorillibacterium timonense]|uniref:putative amidoligase domain-containing protein n=1 Tax=Gorillibacterium timonense TaxID=1689269 RepID=UPI000D52A4E5